MSISKQQVTELMERNPEMTLEEAAKQIGAYNREELVFPRLFHDKTPEAHAKRCWMFAEDQSFITN